MSEVARPGAELYLELLKRCLTRELFLDEEWKPFDYHLRSRAPGLKWRVMRPALDRLRRHSLVLCRKTDDTPRTRTRRQMGWARSPTADTMRGRVRLDALDECVRTVVAEDVPGDLIEAGAWRGGVCIFMRGALKAYGDRTRAVWVADSFQGLPPPAAMTFPLDRRTDLWITEDRAVTEEQVRANFERYGLLDDRVRFLPGWFRDTLPSAPIERLSLARLDGDLYESTTQALTHLYPKLSPGGFLVVDDFHDVVACRTAVEHYRRDHGIGEDIVEIDGSAVYWRKTNG